MEITRTSIHSGITRTLDLDVTPEQLALIESKEGYIQDIVAHLSKDDREFILTGLTPEEWDDLFCDEDAFDDDDEEGYETTAHSEGDY